jgi:flagellar basal body-associated protein FliL
METSIIIALVSFLGTVIVGFFQFRLIRSQAKKEDATTENIHIKSSIDVNTFYTELVKSITAERDYFKTENIKLREDNDSLRVRLKDCEE